MRNRYPSGSLLGSMISRRTLARIRPQIRGCAGAVVTFLIMGWPSQPAASSFPAHVYDMQGRAVGLVSLPEPVHGITITRLPPSAVLDAYGRSRTLPAGVYLTAPTGTERSGFKISRHGSCRFEDLTETHLPQESWCAEDVESADLTGEGLTDIVFCRSVLAAQGGHTPFRPRIWIQTPDSIFVNETELRLPSLTVPSKDVELFDADDDGDIDILLTGCGAVDYSPATLLLNDGSGFFSLGSAGQLPTFDQGSFSTYAEAAHLNEDQSVDLIVLVTSPTGITTRPELWLNNGEGHFVRDTEGRLPDVAYGYFEITVSDVDHDGRNDLLFANLDIDGSAPGRSACFRNMGNGFFLDETVERLPELSTLTKKLVCGDADGDGDVDILELGILMLGQPITVLLNDGLGRFTPCNSAFPEVAEWINDAEFALLNGDFLPDLFLANVMLGAPAEDILLLNDGHGGFVDSSALLPDCVDFSVACALFDHGGDRDVDIFTANSGTGPGNDDLYGQNALYGNLTGKPSVHGEPDARNAISLRPASPNPFGSSTTLRYALRTSGDVIIRVHDLGGRCVEILVNAAQPVGEQYVVWQPKQLGAGVYCYQVLLGDTSIRGETIVHLP